jgi:hypothetical protein
VGLLYTVYFSMLTRTGDNAGTDSAVSLLIADGGEDRLVYRSVDTPQEDQESGQANLYQIGLDVQHRSRWIDDTRLVDGDIRVGLLGDDAWEPEVLFLWGTYLADQRIVPLAIETNITTKLSTNDAGAVPSMSIRLVNTGSLTMVINELLLVLETEGESEYGGFWSDLWRIITTGSVAQVGSIPHGTGTNSPIQLQITAGGELVVQWISSNTPQDDLQAGQANLYFVPVAVPFTRAAMGRDAVRLSILGTDTWLPGQLFLFGLNKSGSRPTAIVPLVHIDDWEMGFMSTDTSKGKPEVVLPLVFPQDFVPTTDRS